MSEQRSGRTLAQIQALPPRAVFVVHSREMRLYAEYLIREVHGREVAEGIDVCVCSRRNLAFNALAGRTQPVILDHAFADHVPKHVLDYTLELANGCNAVVS